MWNRDRSVMLSRIVGYIFIVLVVVSLFCMKLVVETVAGKSGIDGQYITVLTVNLYAVAPFALCALISLELLLKNVSDGTVFSPQSIKLLRIISWCAFAIAAIFLVMTYFYTTALIIALAAAFLGLCLRTVKNVIAKGYEIKTENDLTV